MDRLTRACEIRCFSLSVKTMCMIRSLADRAARARGIPPAAPPDELMQTVIGGTSRRHCFQLRRSSNNRDRSEREFSRWFYLTGEISPFPIPSSSAMTKELELQIKYARQKATTTRATQTELRILWVWKKPPRASRLRTLHAFAPSPKTHVRFDRRHEQALLIHPGLGEDFLQQFSLEERTAQRPR